MCDDVRLSKGEIAFNVCIGVCIVVFAASIAGMMVACAVKFVMWLFGG